MGMRPSDFDEMTVAQFIYAWLGWIEAEQAKERWAWERERWAVYMNMVLQLDPKDRRPMTEMLPLDWDKPQEHPSEQKKTLTIEERRRRALALTQQNE